MFYSTNLDNFLRFGDVVRGYVTSRPIIKRPFSSVNIDESYDYDKQIDYDLDIDIPAYSVIITPCCSIEDGMVSITPLTKLKPFYFKNPNFVNDFTIINRPIDPQLAFMPTKWEQKTIEEKQSITEKAKGKPYTELSIFIYGPNGSLKPYTLKGNTVSHYMIDFRNITTIRCQMIKRPEDLTPDEAPLIASKVLQLSEITRKELREKISFYYGRSPEEDLTILAGRN
jgi:hypothetical protein